MKGIALLLLASLSVAITWAQKKEVVKEVVSKEETISYIDKKCKEAIGHTRITIDNNVFLHTESLSDSHCKQTLNGIELYNQFEFEKMQSDMITTFDPKHIVSIKNTSSELAPKSPIGSLQIKLIGATGLHSRKGVTNSVDSVILYFLQADPENARKIEKALFYLKDISKAEDNTFTP